MEISVSGKKSSISPSEWKKWPKFFIIWTAVSAGMGGREGRSIGGKGEWRRGREGGEGGMK